MKKMILPVVFSLMCSCSLAQQGKPINDQNAQTRNLKGFHAVNVSAGIDLYLSQGQDAVAVSAAKPEWRDKIQTTVENGVLKIYLQNTGAHLIWGFSNPRLKAYVSAAVINNLRASGGSDVFFQGTIRSDKLDIRLSGGSDLNGQVDIKELLIDQSGGSDVDISGTVGNLSVDASGGSDLKAYELVTDNCHIVASGGSDAEVTVNKELTAEASGGSDIYYKGSGVVKEVRSSGSSSVKKRG